MEMDVEVRLGHELGGREVERSSCGIEIGGGGELSRRALLLELEGHAGGILAVELDRMKQRRRGGVRAQGRSRRVMAIGVVVGVAERRQPAEEWLVVGQGGGEPEMDGTDRMTLRGRRRPGAGGTARTAEEEGVALARARGEGQGDGVLQWGKRWVS